MDYVTLNKKVILEITQVLKIFPQRGREKKGYLYMRKAINKCRRNYKNRK